MKIQHRQIWPLVSIVCLLIFVACSEEAPTAPEPDPLVGRWLGTFTSPVMGPSEPSSFSITIQTSGEAVGTGRYFYIYQQNQCVEHLFLDLEVTPDGMVSGTGRWSLLIVGVGYLEGEGKISGMLDTQFLNGNGRLLVEDAEGVIEIGWEISKDSS